MPISHAQSSGEKRIIDDLAMAVKHFSQFDCCSLKFVFVGSALWLWPIRFAAREVKDRFLAVCSWQTTRPECRQSVGGRAYADQHTLDPTTSRQLLPPFAREMTCQVYDSALGAWGCLIPAFESTLPGRLSNSGFRVNSSRQVVSAVHTVVFEVFTDIVAGSLHDSAL